MIKFFRKIRQRMLTENKFNKYLLYATGEIILVVIGILIALQVNNWNEERKQKIQVTTYAKALVEDLKEDIRKVKTIKWQARKSHLVLDSLTNYSRNLDIKQMTNFDLFILSIDDGYKPFSWNRASFEEIKSSGVLNYFKNDSLVNLLVKYEAFTKHMDLDYQQDVEAKLDARRLMRKVVNYNYKFDRILTIVKFDDDDSLRIKDYSNIKGFIAMKQQKIDFIDRDRTKLEEAINAYVELKSYLRVRYNGELPRLIKNAETIIKILEENYIKEN